MVSSFALVTSVFAAGAFAWPPSWQHGPPGYHPAPPVAPGYSQKWNLANFTSMVVFGDSYTDDSRLGYFISHNGSAPPTGYANPESLSASDGGRIWVRYVEQYTGANIYNYAVSGAVCNNDITPRYFSAIYADFPDVQSYEVPAYLNDSAYVYPNGSRFLDIPVDSTVYTMWIGTNDLGYDAFISDEEVAGTNITSYVDCVYSNLDRLYANGGRFFVLMDVAPLNLAPMYEAPPYATGPDQFWQTKSGNYTEINGRMMEQVVTTNAIYQYRTPYEVEIAKRYPGASFAVYDVHGLMTDIYNNPSAYLNGSAPLNVTGFVSHCNINGTACVNNPSPDSFLWYNELHPSEQTDRIIAMNYVDVVKGASQWATYWSS